jgi:hypothetical protein
VAEYTTPRSFKFISVAENAEKNIWIKLYDNKYFYGTFNSNFSLQNKQLQQTKQKKTLIFKIPIVEVSQF